MRRNDARGRRGHHDLTGPRSGLQGDGARHHGADREQRPLRAVADDHLGGARRNADRDREPDVARGGRHCPFRSQRGLHPERGVDGAPGMVGTCEGHEQCVAAEVEHVATERCDTADERREAGVDRVTEHLGTLTTPAGEPLRQSGEAGEVGGDERAGDRPGSRQGPTAQEVRKVGRGLHGVVISAPTRTTGCHRVEDDVGGQASGGGQLAVGVGSLEVPLQPRDGHEPRVVAEVGGGLGGPVGVLAAGRDVGAGPDEVGRLRQVDHGEEVAGGDLERDGANGRHVLPRPEHRVDRGVVAAEPDEGFRRASRRSRAAGDRDVVADPEAVPGDHVVGITLQVGVDLDRGALHHGEVRRHLRAAVGAIGLGRDAHRPRSLRCARRVVGPDGGEGPGEQLAGTEAGRELRGVRAGMELGDLGLHGVQPGLATPGAEHLVVGRAQQGGVSGERVGALVAEDGFLDASAHVAHAGHAGQHDRLARRREQGVGGRHQPHVHGGVGRPGLGDARGTGHRQGPDGHGGDGLADRSARHGGDLPARSRRERCCG